MQDQHTLIKGYRDLTQEEINLMNQGKELAAEVGLFINHLKHIDTLDQRWVQIAETDLQKGFMAAIRSIAQPTSF